MKMALVAIVGLAVACSSAQAQWTASGTDIYYPNTGEVGIGAAPATNTQLDITSTLLYGIYSQTTASFGMGVFGLASNSGTGYGVRGRATGSTGIGLYGEATSTASGAHYAIYGNATGPDGHGLYAENTYASGTTYGVRAHVASTGGRAISALASASSGTNIAVVASTNSSSGYGLYVTGGRNYMQGNLGVGTDQPATKLHVDGTARFVNLASTTASTRGALGIDASNGNASSRSFGAGNGVIAFSTPGSDTWTVPAGVTTIKVRAWGGGGGATLASSPDTGGGSGAYVEAYMSVTPADVLDIEVGAGGDTTGNWPGGNGGDSGVSGVSATVSAGGGYSWTTCPTGPCTVPSFAGGGTYIGSGATGDGQDGISLSSGDVYFAPPAANGRMVRQYDSAGTSYFFSVPGTGGGIESSVPWKGAQGYVIIEW